MSENESWEHEINGKLSDLVACVERRERELVQRSQKLESDREGFEQEMKIKRQEQEKVIEQQYKDLEEMRVKIENEKKRMHEVYEFQSSPVHLNIGGHRFTTSLQTLRRDQDSMLATMFSGRHKLLQEPDGSYFVDRDGTHFRHILNYLRDGFHAEMFPQDELSLRQIVNEAQYYQLNGLIAGIETVLDPPPPAPDFTQTEINDMLATLTRQSTSSASPPPGLDLGTSRPKLADFVFHNMTKTNLDFSRKNLAGLSFAHTTFAHNVSFVDACLVNTSFYGCEFASHIVVDFTEADLSGADFRQCRCVQSGPNAFNGLGGVPVGGGGGFMFGSSCSSFAHLIKTGHVKFTGAKHIGTKFEQHIRDLINF
ncbi:uncharacterized protein [Montipora capricornis]|uniref:uncharacterized protein n=1 Tax=Montipora foliosa TaxID=591990 RepID=UPI0035F1E02E